MSRQTPRVDLSKDSQGGGVVWGPDRVWTGVGQVSDTSSLMSFTWKSFNLLRATSSSVNWMIGIGTSLHSRHKCKKENTLLCLLENYY